MSIKTTFNNLRNGIRKNSPTILLVTGIAEVVGAAIWACITTAKSRDISKNREEAILEVKEDVTRGELEEKESKKIIRNINFRAAADYAKRYIPSVALMTLGVVSLVGGHKINMNRNVSLVAAYASLKDAYDEYRHRVAEELGDEKENDLYSGNCGERVLVTTETDANGKEQVVKRTEKNHIGKPLSPYAKLFDECNNNWEKDAQGNLYFLRRQEEYANTMLQAKGVLFLNDVYASLGIPKTKAGQIVGWRYKAGTGNDYVSFGLNDADFVNGHERSVWLDFNVDGPVFTFEENLHEDIPNQGGDEF